MGVRIFKFAFGGLLAGLVAVIAWSELSKLSYTQSVTSDLTVAGDCELTWGADVLWRFSIKPGETISRFSLVNFPASASWMCKTSKGVVRGGLDDSGCRNTAALRDFWVSEPSPPDPGAPDVFC